MMSRRENRYWIFAATATTIVLFFVFKLFYPYPNMVMDSYMYVKAAVLNLNANSYPIGYSKFLQLFGFFSRSATLFVWLQYGLLESACLWLFLTLLYFFRPSKPVAYIVFAFFFCNPLFLYTSNFIMSDALFTAVSVCWITQLIWIVCRPRSYMIWIQAGLLLIAFTIRYNALYYPAIACLALLMSRLRLGYKIGGIILQFLLIVAFVRFTTSEMQQLTGIKQFSPFGGWQLANNALYMYGHIDPKDRTPVPARFQDLDSSVRHYFDSSHRTESLLDYEAEGPGFYYQVSPNSPLITYMNRLYGKDTVFQNYQKWGSMADICSGYGACLIKKYPVEFTRFWVWPNTLRYLNPPSEIFSMLSPYFLRPDQFGKMAQQQFHLKTLTVGWPLINFRTSLLSSYPLFFMLLNVFYLMAFLGFYLFRGFKKVNKTLGYPILLTTFLWACNLGFSVTASCVVLRYQIFIMIIEFAFTALLVDFIYGKANEKAVKNG